MSALIDITAPASKSMSHRACIAAALAPGTSRLTGVLDSDDIHRTRDILTAAGASFAADGDALVVTGMQDGPMGSSLGEADDPLDCNVGESGTTCRLLTGVLAAGKGRFHVHGEGRMHQRPIAEPARALHHFGIEFVWLGEEGYPPFVLVTRGLPGGEVSVSLEESSHYLSGLLLAAPLAQAPTAVSVGGSKVVSWPYVALTLTVLQDFGLTCRVYSLEDGEWAERDFREMTAVEPGKVRFLVDPGAYRARDYAVEGDWSNASYFLAAGAVGPNPVRVTGLRQDSLQGDRAILDILAAMGAVVSWDAGAVTVSPPASGALSGTRVDMGHCPDLVPTVATAAALAQGPTTITNVAHLRIKESDRLAALASELGKAGARVETFADGLTVTPAPLRTGETLELDSHGDHRLVMGPSILGLGGVDVRFDHPECVGKSFPGFFEQWNAVLAAAKGAA
mgnify:CR=1 FL=1